CVGWVERSETHRRIARGIGGFRSARPTPTRLPANSAGVQAPGQNAFLGVQAVLGLVEHNRLRPLDHLVRDLLAPMGPQAKHENRATSGPCPPTRACLTA